MKTIFVCLIVILMTTSVFAQSRFGGFGYAGKTNSPDNGTQIIGAGGLFRMDKEGAAGLGTVKRVWGQFDVGSISQNRSFKNLDDIFLSANGEFVVFQQSTVGVWIFWHKFPGADSLHPALDSVRNQFDFALSYSGFLKNVSVKLGYVIIPHEFEKKLNESAYRLSVGYEKKEGDFRLQLLGGMFFQEGEAFDFEYSASMEWEVLGPILLRAEYGVKSLPLPSDKHYQISSGRLCFVIFGNL